jgi:hypothetical protein
MQGFHGAKQRQISLRGPPRACFHFEIRLRPMVVHMVRSFLRLSVWMVGMKAARGLLYIIDFEKERTGHCGDFF